MNHLFEPFLCKEPIRGNDSDCSSLRRSGILLGEKKWTLAAR